MEYRQEIFLGILLSNSHLLSPARARTEPILDFWSDLKFEKTEILLKIALLGGSKSMVDLESNFQNCINDLYRPLQGLICALLIQNIFQHVS